MSLNSSPTILSRRSSASSGSLPTNMSLDLSSIPPLAQPTPPSNTLLFTNLQDTDIFLPENLESIKSLVAHSAPIHSWAPLKSFRRIVVSFYDEESAIKVRGVWDGENVMGHRTRVFFGQHTPVQARSEHLALPDAGKLFFISPPPSPPHGWEMKLEDPPNKQVHAEDLADALAKLHHRTNPAASLEDDLSPVSPGTDNGDQSMQSKTRSRSSTVVVWHPEEHGADADLPAISVEDMTAEPEAYDGITRGLDPILSTKALPTRTARPPVELMQE